MIQTYVLTQDFLYVKSGTLIKVKNGTWTATPSGQKGGFKMWKVAKISIKVEYFPHFFKELSREEEQAIEEAKKLLTAHNYLFLTANL